MRKKSAAHIWETGMVEKTSGYTTNTRPGPRHTAAQTQLQTPGQDPRHTATQTQLKTPGQDLRPTAAQAQLQTPDHGLDPQIKLQTVKGTVTEKC